MAWYSNITWVRSVPTHNRHQQSHENKPSVQKHSLFDHSTLLRMRWHELYNFLRSVAVTGKATTYTRASTCTRHEIERLPDTVTAQFLHCTLNYCCRIRSSRIGITQHWAWNNGNQAIYGRLSAAMTTQYVMMQNLATQYKVHVL